MKRAVALLLTAVLGAAVLCGCQGQGASSAKEKLPTVSILTEAACKGDVEVIADTVRYLGGKAKYVVEVLPSDRTEREAAVKRLKVEVMSGKGPDVFLLSCPEPAGVKEGTTDEGQSPDVQLFPSPEASMRNGIFLPLDSWIAKSKVLHTENFVQPVLQAGRTDEGQQLLPLRYTFPAVAVLQSAMADPQLQLTSWQDILACRDPAVRAAFHTLAVTTDFSTCVFPTFADYRSEKIAVTQEMFVQRALEWGELRLEKVQGAVQGSTMHDGMLNLQGLKQLEEAKSPYALLPLSNTAGAITAKITSYVAISRRSAHPQEAFAFVETLLRDEVQSGKGMQEGGRHHGDGLFRYDYLPVNSQLLKTPGSGVALSDATGKTLQALAKRIRSAQFFSGSDWTLAQAFRNKRIDNQNAKKAYQEGTAQFFD